MVECQWKVVIIQGHLGKKGYFHWTGKWFAGGIFDFILKINIVFPLDSELYSLKMIYGWAGAMHLKGKTMIQLLCCIAQ